MSERVVLGEEANRIGLVDHLAEPDALLDEAIAYAADLAANCSPTAMAIVNARSSPASTRASGSPSPSPSG